MGASYFFACAPTTGSGVAGAGGDVASRVYVAPGSYDDYYAFLSGGFSGQLAVYGLPSGRLLKVIPVFAQNPENGYGYNAETKAMLETTWGNIPWDYTHHPSLSVTDGVHDGRWIFITANTRASRASISHPDDDRDHSDPIPPATTLAIRTQAPSMLLRERASAYDPASDLPSALRAELQGRDLIHQANEPGKMRISWQFVVPGYDYDLARAGKGPSADWIFSRPTTRSMRTRRRRSRPRKTTRTS